MVRKLQTVKLTLIKLNFPNFPEVRIMVEVGSTVDPNTVTGTGPTIARDATTDTGTTVHPDSPIGACPANARCITMGHANVTAADTSRRDSRQNAHSGAAGNHRLTTPGWDPNNNIPMFTTPRPNSCTFSGCRGDLLCGTSPNHSSPTRGHDQPSPVLPQSSAPVQPAPGTTVLGRPGPGHPVMVSTGIQTKQGKAPTSTRCNVVNLSDYVPDDDELEQLGMGLAFIPTPQQGRFSRKNLVSDFDTLRTTHMARYCGGPPSTSDRIKTAICDHIVEQLHNLEPKGTIPNIVVSQADKGDAAVVMNTSDYTRMAWQHLADGETYTPLSEDPTPTIVDKFNAYLRHCRDDRVIDPGLHDQLRLANDTVAQTISTFCRRCTRCPSNCAPSCLVRGDPGN